MEFVEKVSPVNAPLEKSETCNVMFVYIHPEDCKNDTRRWLGVVSCTPVKKARVDPNLVKAYSIIQNYEAIVQGRVNKDAHKNRTFTNSELQDKTNFNDEVDAYLCPYKVEHYLTDNLNAVFFLSRLMAKILSSADFIVVDVTFPSVADFPYLLNHSIT
ncbi:hypothetical protein ACROYT_G011574 [Oculina patagonica]